MSVDQTLAQRSERAIAALDPEAASAAMEHVLATGDLAQFSPKERIGYYLYLCKKLGIDSEQRPFDWLTLDGKLVFYPNKNCAEQLRRKHQISIELVRKEAKGDLFVVEVKGWRPNGQQDFASKYVSLRDQRGNLLTGRQYENALHKAECVPVASEILTRGGWRTYDHLTIGQDVLAYDLETDTCRWTPLQNVTVYEEALTVRMGTPTRSSFRCTPDHSWAVQHAPYRPDRRGDGSRGPHGPYANRRPLRQLMEAARIAKSDRIVLAAPAPGGEHVLTPHEAAILGWIMTDGNIRRRASHVRCTIYQSKPDRIEEIEQLVAASGYHPARVTLPATTRDFTGVGRSRGGVSECLPQRRWVFSAYDSRALLAKAGIEQTTDMIGLVTRLSPEARAAMLAAMMAGDGDARGNFGTKTKPGVMEAWEILATLQGHALGRLSSEDRDVRVRRLRVQRTLTGKNLTISAPAVERVWCPTTAYGTWVMRQDGQITITGNTGAKRRLTFSLVGLSGVPDLDDLASARVVTVDAHGNVLDRPTEQQKYLAETPAAARVIGEPTFETTATPDDSPVQGGPSQAPTAEELTRPPRTGPRPTFRATDEQIAHWKDTWGAIVKGSSLSIPAERARFIGQWTASEGWPEGKRTDSLATMLARATEREVEDLLAHVRALVDDERRANAEALADLHRGDTGRPEGRGPVVREAQEDGPEQEAF